MKQMRLDSELEPFLGSFPPASLSDPVTAREQLAALAAVAPAPDTTGMEIEDRVVPGHPSVPVRIYRPRQAHGAIVWLHGGGFVMGDLETEHPWAVRIAETSAATVVSVDYRRAPEERFPAAFDDVYAAFTWTVENAARARDRPGKDRRRWPRCRRRVGDSGGVARPRRARSDCLLPAPQPARAR